MKTRIRRYGRAAAAIALLQLACAHAPPLGNKDPDAQVDPDNPEVNCKIYTTIDCRPANTW